MKTIQKKKIKEYSIQNIVPKHQVLNLGIKSTKYEITLLGEQQATLERVKYFRK